MAADEGIEKNDCYRVQCIKLMADDEFSYKTNVEREHSII